MVSETAAHVQAKINPLTAFESWAKRARIGERRVYYRGFLAYDRGLRQGISPAKSELCRLACQMAEAGYLHLFQRRAAHGTDGKSGKPGSFDYIAEVAARF